MKFSLIASFVVALSLRHATFADTKNTCQIGQSQEEALFCALERLDAFEVQRLIAAGVKVNVCINNTTPLLFAIYKVTCGYDVIDSIKKLLSAGASFDITLTLEDHDTGTVGEYATEMMQNYLEALATHTAIDNDIQICVKRAQKVLKLIKKYSSQADSSH